jgi:hypothetical protein
VAQKDSASGVLVALALGCALTLDGSSAIACSCMRISPAHAFAGSEQVFAGEMIARGRPAGFVAKPGVFSSADPVEYAFVVTHVWKGAIAETLRVRSAESSASCGYDFTPGVHYLVYARAAQGSLWTGACSRNSDLRLAVWDRFWLPAPHVLDTGRPVTKVTRGDLVALLNGNDRELRFHASEALGGSPEIRTEVLPVLRDIVRGRAPGNAESAARAIGEMRDGARSAESDLDWLRSHGTGPERAAALEALIRTDPLGTNRHILDALSDPTPECLTAACEHAARLAHADSIEYGRPAAARLTRLIRHPHFNVRAHAIFALQYFPAAGLAVASDLETMSQADTSSYVRYAARLTTKRLTGRSLPFR